MHFRKRLTPEILAEINEMVISEAEKKDKQDEHNDNNSGNGGTMIVDATCAPSNIRYPQDVSLLNLRKIQCAFLRFLDWLLGFLMPCEKLVVNQETLNIISLCRLCVYKICVSKC